MEQTKQQRQTSINDNDNNKTKLTVDFDRLIKNREESLSSSTLMLNFFSFSSSTKPVTYFEDLSNEIIYEVFEFLDYCYIYEAFFDLNRRFRNLLTRLPLPIFINISSISKTTFERFYTNIIVPYQRQIKSLHLSNPLIIKHVFSSISSPLVLTRLEKLSLTDIDPEYLKEFPIHLASLPCLLSLIIKCIGHC